MKIASAKIRSRRSRGLGLMLTLSSIVFVTVAALSMSMHFANQARRARNLPIAGQHRLLLNAARDVLLARLNATDKIVPTFTLALPTEAEKIDVQCTLDPSDPTIPARYQLTATSGGFTTRDTLTFTKINGKFRIADAQLSKDIH